MTIFQNYINHILKRAEYRFDKETNQWVGLIPDMDVVWAAGETVEEVRAELSESIEGWVLLSIKQGDRLPEVDSINLSQRIFAHA